MPAEAAEPDRHGVTGSDLLRYRQRHYFPLDRLELGRIPLRIRRRSAQLIDLLIHALDAIPRIRMVRQKLRRIFSFDSASSFSKN